MFRQRKQKILSTALILLVFVVVLMKPIAPTFAYITITASSGTCKNTFTVDEDFLTIDLGDDPRETVRDSLPTTEEDSDEEETEITTETTTENSTTKEETTTVASTTKKEKTTVKTEKTTTKKAETTTKAKLSNKDKVSPNTGNDKGVFVSLAVAFATVLIIVILIGKKQNLRGKIFNGTSRR
jgi:preprotein translocase subunit SecF